MTTKVETVNEDRKHTRWHTLKTWILTLDEGMNYDPQEHTNTTLRQLLRKVEQLETRVSEIEGWRATR